MCIHVHRDAEALSIWTIYDRPNDLRHLARFVARRSEIREGRIAITDELLSAENIYMLRRTFAEAGLMRFSRAPGDDPVMVEVWM
jgi:hypothetical protein